jgi:hypothetical protein
MTHFKIMITSHEGKVTILWKQLVPNDRNIPSNEADIKIRDNEKGARTLMHTAISLERNMTKK